MPEADSPASGPSREPTLAGADQGKARALGGVLNDLVEASSVGVENEVGGKVSQTFDAAVDLGKVPRLTEAPMV